MFEKEEDKYIRNIGIHKPFLPVAPTVHLTHGLETTVLMELTNRTMKLLKFIFLILKLQNLQYSISRRTKKKQKNKTDIAFEKKKVQRDSSKIQNQSTNSLQLLIK